MTSIHPKKIILCADDFGQSQAISEGILNLASQGRLSAISCMVNGPAWEAQCAKLRKYDEIGMGLHLNFTHGEPLSQEWQQHVGEVFSGLTTLLLKSIPPKVIHAEIKAQILKFKQELSIWPQFIDGHQHVHQLPSVAKELIQTVQYLNFKPWFRTTYDFHKVLSHPLVSLKQWALCILGGSQWHRRLNELGYSHNLDFSGDYRFTGRPHYQHLMHEFLQRIGDRGLIMCHPGLEDVESGDDPIAAYRLYEFEYLMSEDFIQDLDYFQIELVASPI